MGRKKKKRNPEGMRKFDDARIEEIRKLIGGNLALNKIPKLVEISRKINNQEKLFECLRVWVSEEIIDTRKAFEILKARKKLRNIFKKNESLVEAWGMDLVVIRMLNLEVDSKAFASKILYLLWDVIGIEKTNALIDEVIEINR